MVSNRTQSPAVQKIIEAVQQTIEDWRDEGESLRDLPTPILEALKRAAAFRFWTPRVFGGDENDLTSGLRLLEDLAGIDASTSWVLGNALSVTAQRGTGRQEMNRLLFRTPDVQFAGAAFPPGTALREGGGYRVTAQWAFNSGCSGSDWIFGAAVLSDGNAPILDGNGQPQFISLLIPTTEVEIVDTWRTLGMRGTGSHDVALKNHFVPDGLATQFDPQAPRDPAFAAPLYRLGFAINPLVIGAIASGIAGAAAADAFTLAAAKTAAWMSSPLGDRATVQFWLGRARARVGAARAYLYQTAQEAVTELEENAALGLPNRIQCLLAGSHAIEAAVEAIDLVQRVVGTSGIRSEGRFQQYFRDIHTLNQHAFGSENRYETASQLLLGRNPDLAWVLA